jgi:single-strand DNA-binding protein
MSETYVTVVGNVATHPELRQTSSGVPVTRFRLATTERRYDRASDRWSDGHTNFYTVWAWRNLGENVCGSLAMGEPVIVQGKLRVVEREDKGQNYVSASIDAATIGHDLSRGTSAFRRVFKARGEWGDRAAEEAGEPTVSDDTWLQPPPRSGPGTTDAPPEAPAPATATASPRNSTSRRSTTKPGSAAGTEPTPNSREPELVSS